MKKSYEFLKLVIYSITEHIVIINKFDGIVFVNKILVTFCKKIPV